MYTSSFLPNVPVQISTFTMEEGNDFPGPEYSCLEDVSGSSMVPLSYIYTPFYVQIPNNYSNVRSPSLVDHQCSSEDERACPSSWDCDLNTYSYSCPLCCDPSSSLMFHCPPVCSSDGPLPHADQYELPNCATASHTWTPGGDVQCQMPSVSERVFTVQSNSGEFH